MMPPVLFSGTSAVDQLLSNEEVALVARSHDLGLSPSAIAAAVEVGRMVRGQRGGRSTNSVQGSEPPEYNFGES